MNEKTPEERLALINRVAQWCFDKTNSWEPDNIGTGLAYLFWVIAAPGSEAPFLCGREESGETYDALVDLIKSNPNGLWQQLLDGGYVQE